MFESLFSILLILTPCIGYCEAPAGPTETIKITIQHLKEIDSNYNGEERYQKAWVVLNEVFDKERLSRFSLGSIWNKATKKEQEKFVELFSELIFYTYIKRLKEINKSEIKYKPDKESEKKALVRTEISYNNQLYSLNYRMYKKTYKWQVYDVIIENVSLSSNYRSEFAHLVRKHGFPKFLELLEKKVNSLCRKSSLASCGRI